MWHITVRNNLNKQYENQKANGTHIDSIIYIQVFIQINIKRKFFIITRNGYKGVYTL